MNGSLSDEKQDQLVAAARAEALQVMQDAERTLIQLARRRRCAPSVALEVGDVARPARGWLSMSSLRVVELGISGVPAS